MHSRSLRFLLIATVGGFSGYALLLPVVPMWAVAGGAGETAAGATNAVFMLVTVLTQLAMPWVLQRVDIRGLFAAGTVLIGAPTPLFAISPELWTLLGVSAMRGIGFGLLTVFERLRSELETTVVESLELSFAVFVCPPPETVPVFVKLEAAVCETLTTSVMTG